MADASDRAWEHVLGLAVCSPPTGGIQLASGGIGNCTKMPESPNVSLMLPQDTPFVSTMNPLELFATNQREERVKLAHVFAPCTVQLRPPRLQRHGSSVSPDKSTYFCMYHWNHIDNTLSQLMP